MCVRLIVEVSVNKYRSILHYRELIYSGNVMMFVFDQYVTGLLYPEWFFNKYFSKS